MFSKDKLRVILIKPSKYAEDGSVERFWRGFIPNSTLSYMYSMTLAYIEETGANIELFAVDEYVQDDLDYLQLLEQRDSQTLVALVGVQSHQIPQGTGPRSVSPQARCPRGHRWPAYHDV